MTKDIYFVSFGLAWNSYYFSWELQGPYKTKMIVGDSALTTPSMRDKDLLYFTLYLVK